VFRRRASDAPALLEEEPEAGPEQDGQEGSRPGFTAAKGRPTPKRSEVEKRRRQPYTAPGDRKAASQQSRDRDRGTRQRRMEAMRRGEDWALPRKDQGKVRALARDVVDARRGISEYYLYGVAALVLLLFIPGLRGSGIVAILLIIIGEGWWVSRRVIALAQERFPGESVRGVRMYTALRGTQLRRLRMPSPRVKIGDKV
jgi:hypothetical protein